MEKLAKLNFNIRSACLDLEGELSFQTAMDLLAQSLPYFDQGLTVLQVAQVSRVDSAGLALLCEWYKLAAHHQRQLRLEGASDALISMLKLHGLEDLFLINGS